MVGCWFSLYLPLPSPSPSHSYSYSHSHSAYFPPSLPHCFFSISLLSVLTFLSLFLYSPPSLSPSFYFFLIPLCFPPSLFLFNFFIALLSTLIPCHPSVFLLRYHFVFFPYNLISHVSIPPFPLSLSELIIRYSLLDLSILSSFPMVPPSFTFLPYSLIYFLLITSLSPRFLTFLLGPYLCFHCFPSSLCITPPYFSLLSPVPLPFY